MRRQRRGGIILGGPIPTSSESAGVVPTTATGQRGDEAEAAVGAAVDENGEAA